MAAYNITKWAPTSVDERESGLYRAIRNSDCGLAVGVMTFRASLHKVEGAMI